MPSLSRAHVATTRSAARRGALNNSAQAAARATTASPLSSPPTKHSSRSSSPFSTPTSSSAAAAAAVPPALRSRRLLRCSATAKIDVDAWASSESQLRSEFLEKQARRVLRRAAEEAERPAFPCALIAGDIVILSLLASENLLEKIPVIFIDTFHLFPETHELLAKLEKLYNFKAKVFQPAGFATKAEYVKKHGSDLYLTDIDEYDRICKVEPFGRSLQELKVDAMINGRRRDHGAERAHLQLVDAPARAGAAVNVQPLAWWEFEDCMNFLEKNNVPKHALFDQGYPSVGDVHSTLPVPREKWFEYAGERSGRFVGLTNADGSTKTECGTAFDFFLFVSKSKERREGVRAGRERERGEKESRERATTNLILLLFLFLEKQQHPQHHQTGIHVGGGKA